MKNLKFFTLVLVTFVLGAASIGWALDPMPMPKPAVLPDPIPHPAAEGQQSPQVVLPGQPGWVLPNDVPSGQLTSIELDTDRPGMDYKNFDLSAPDSSLCANACRNEPNCKSWTYVKPGVQGPSARCWLKTGVPSSVKNSCCISGVIVSPVRQGIKKKDIERVSKQLGIHTSCSANPGTLFPGGVTELVIKATSTNNVPIKNAQVKVDAGGGTFLDSNSYSVEGQTDLDGLFKTSWKSPSPAAAAYVLGVRVSKPGFVEGYAECTIPISQ